jgi:hypothetical protein
MFDRRLGQFKGSDPLNSGTGRDTSWWAMNAEKGSEKGSDPLSLG